MRFALLLVLVATSAGAVDGGSNSNYLNCQAVQAQLSDGGMAWQVIINTAALAPNAARASKQPNFGAPSFPSRDTVSVQGVPFMTPLKVDGTDRVQPVSGYVQILDAGVLNVNFPATQAVSLATAPALVASSAMIGHVIVDSSGSVPVTGTFWQTTQPVSVASMPSTPVTGTFWQGTQPVSASALPLPTGAATDSTLSQLFDGGVVIIPSGVQRVAGTVTVGQTMRSAFIPLCNNVRRTNCQP